MATRERAALRSLQAVDRPGILSARVWSRKVAGLSHAPPSALDAILTLSPALQTCLLLFASNIFMTIAWYGRLTSLRTAPLIVAILVNWMIALAEYALQVPANRIG